MPESVHSFARHSDIGEDSPFGELSQKLREWMGNMVNINHILHLKLCKDSTDAKLNYQSN